LVLNDRNLDAADRIEENKEFIAYEAYGYITAKYPSLLIKSGITIEKCRRDIGYLIDATVQDLRLGGNINTIQAAESYYVGNNLSYIIGELSETLEGYNYARDLAIAAMRNYSYLRQGATTTASSSIVNVGDTSGIVQGMVVADYDPSQFTDGKLNSGATRPASPAIPDNTFVKRVIDATTIELGQKATFSEKKVVSDRFGDARDLMLANKAFIAAEAYDRMVLDFPGFVTPTGNSQDCIDDIVDVIEAVAENTAFGGNAETFDAAYLYETGAHVSGEEAETVKAFTYARDMCIQVMRNEDVFVFGTHGLTQTKDTSITYVAPELVADRNGDARDLILANKNLIANEAVERMLQKYPTFTVAGGNQNCIDDVVDLLEAVADNVAYGGNDKTWDAAYSYVKGAHVAGEETETLYVFEQAKEMAAQVMRNQKILSMGSHGLSQTFDSSITYDLPDPVIDRNGDARNLIVANKTLIANEAYARMLAQNAGFVPPTGNAQDCIDDILDFVEEISYNVAFGGNDRTWDMSNLYVTGAHVAGEETQTVQAFDYARDLMVQAMRNEVILPVGSHGLTQSFDNTITVNAPTPTDNKSADAKNLILANKTFIAEIAYGRMQTQYPSFTVPTGNSQDCIDDIIDMIEVVAYNLAFGGNDRTWDAANLYATGAHVAGEEAQTITAFTEAKDIMIEVMRNEAVTVGGHTALTQSFDNTITADTQTPLCPAQESTINTLVTILTNTITSAPLLYNVTRTFSNGSCNDVRSSIETLTAIATNAVTSPGSLASVTRTVSVGSCEDVRSTINTLFKIVEDAVATPTTLSSVLRTVSNGSCQNVASAITTLFQIVNNTILNPGYLQSVDRVESPLGLSFGPSVNANASTTNSYLYFTLTSGVYTSQFSPTTDETITQHTSYPECADQATAIRQFFTNISTIIQTGLNSVPRVEPSQLTTELASRATVWTLRTGQGSNPHNLETGTPVRLVPRPRYDSVTNSYVDVDKRKIRLPNGFETNELYYVIAPARKTKPEPYEGTSIFNGSDQTKIMLASSKENAAAGIYIHSAEVDGIDPDIEIDIYQFVLDDRFDLHQYSCVLEVNTNNRIRTDVPHIFDVPFADISGHKVFFRPNEGGSVPLVGANYAGDPNVADSNGRLRGDKFFWARYQTEKNFTIHTTKADAIADINAITFQSGVYDFSVFADKRESPVRFDPSYQNPGTTPTIYGKWYMQVEDHSSNPQDPQYSMNILTRLHENAYSDQSGQDKTNDTWFERIKDERDKEDRIYRLRYVIPDYLQAVRDPINGFSIKIRKDETRKLLPQKLVLKPVTGSVTKARFFNPVQASEVIGFTKQDFITNSLNEEVAYDPYKRDVVGTTQYAKKIETTNYVSMTIQSGRYFTEQSSGDELLELTVFDLGIENTALFNETFTTVKITAPQGGSFVADKTQSNASNRIEWFGNSSGYGYIHAVLNVPGTSEWHLILKGTFGDIDYSEFENIRFAQGSTFADLETDQDFGKSLVIKDLIRKEYPEYYYKEKGSAVYTITPGDIVTDDDNVQFYVASVEDTGEIDDTFYIFDVEEIQRRIYGQQDGIYYLTAVRGNISPFPTGAGNQGNFRNFKFSQPISKLYPLNYKNDPLWFKQLDVTEVDVPATYSAADNYTHGLVRVNDFKGSMTREMALDFISQDALSSKTYTQVSSTEDNRLRAQKGNAASGSEDRKIPIVGDSKVMADQRLYVELRRPSIARAGNHTFEYLGFGPGNYSTGLPARQEIVLTPTQDFYAQSKKQDGGLVFYTGLNSNGDLYIGNRKIDAITGEEEFLESAALVDSADDADAIDTLVTTFDTPVTFNENIVVNGGDAQDLISTFNSPVTINVLGRVREYALRILSNVSPSSGDDATLDTTQQFLNQDTQGNIVIARNRVAASIFQFNPRGSNGQAQGYKIQNHVVGNQGSNVTPNQSALYSTGLGTSIDATQNVLYGSNAPLSGDMLLKGSEVGSSGSRGWIYANFFEDVPAANILHFTMDGSTVITITWGNNLSNQQVGISSGSQIRISNYSDSGFNGLWQVIGNGFTPTANTCQIALAQNRANVSNDNPRLWSTEVALGNGARLEFSNSNWKEFGVIGSESIRTNTDDIGQYKMGINTIARAPHSAYENAFVSVETDPRANLDVVGNAFISGRIVDDYLDHNNFAARNKQDIDNAFLVGGNSGSPDNEAVFRVATTNGGRVGINVDNSQLDRALVVDGTSRFTDDARFEHDIEVNGDDGVTAEIRTSQTSGTFNLVTDSTFTGTLNVGNSVSDLNVLNTSTDKQRLYIGNASTESYVWFGNTPDTSSNISKITIGGAYDNNESLSFTLIGSKSFKTAGDFQLGTRRGLTDIVKLSSTAGTVEFFAGNSATSKLDFATNASDITIGGQGGDTRVRNNLIVDSTARFNSDVTLCGGYASYSFVADRAQIGSGRISHTSGVLGNNLFNSNVDIISVARVATTDVRYNAVDTSGSGDWGGSVYQNQITTIGGTPLIEPQVLPVLTGNQYYLPIKNKPVDLSGAQYFEENDILLIDTDSSGGTKHPEFVRVVSLPRINVAPFFLVVERLPFGTFTAIRSDHNDTAAIYKCNVQFNSTWITTDLDNTGNEENIYLAQFGGTINLGDYVIISRDDGTPSGDGVDDQGELFKVKTLIDQVAKKLSVKTGCDTANEETVFEVDSVTGNVTISSETTTISGLLTLNGSCTTPYTNSPVGDKLRITNGDDPAVTTFEVDTCTGDTTIGNVHGTVFMLAEQFGTSPSAYTKDSDVVHVYRHNPQSINPNGLGPATTLATAIVPATSNIEIQSNLAAFSIGDLVALYVTDQQIEIIQITDTPRTDTTTGALILPTSTNQTYPAGGRGREGTTAQSFQAGVNVVKLDKYDRTTVLLDDIPATQADRATALKARTPNTSDIRLEIRLRDADLIAPKLDYPTYVRIGTEFFVPDSVDGSLDALYAVKMPKSARIPNNVNTPLVNLYNGGKTKIFDDTTIYGGAFRMYGSDGKTLVLSIANDDGHSGDGSIEDPIENTNGLTLKGAGNIYGDIRVYWDDCQMNGICSTVPSFRVTNREGSVTMGEKFYQGGLLLETENAAETVFHVDNLGSAGVGGTEGPKEFKIYQNNAIDSFGIEKYWTGNGGRRHTYVEFDATTGIGQQQDNPLEVNNNYLINTSSGSNMVLYLPDNAQTGDMIRFVELSGNLTYNTSLIIRAKKVGAVATAIQGDTTGSRVGAGAGQTLATAWDSGELVIQSRNASFGLVYAGSVDIEGSANARTIPPTLRGWWLMEL